MTDMTDDEKRALVALAVAAVEMWVCVLDASTFVQLCSAGIVAGVGVLLIESQKGGAP